MKIKDIIAKTEACIQKKDLEILCPIIRGYRHNVVLEIGTHYGGSAYLWHELLNSRTLITIDIEARARSLPSKTHYISGVSSHDPECVQQVKEILKGKKVDILFIDGNHSYLAAKADFDLYSPMVRNGGLIIFHDVIYFSPPAEDVPQLWKSLKKNYPYIEIAMNNNTSGVGILIKENFIRTEFGQGT